eukprot:m.72791 g.72791  ORF g.72791 m.72791 type:complete len:223 (+) comp35813_c0_seq4:193-861(+)
MQTTAMFDPETQEFVLNTPHYEGTKWWIGILGNVASYAVVFAQLYTPNGECHGIHTFLVAIRDPLTLMSLPGVLVGDLGKKLGQNGLANGFVSFQNVRIPKENLLSRIGEVTLDGKYISHVKDPNKRQGESLGALSAGRVGITGMCSQNLSTAMVIAIRYSAVRRQFGVGKEEFPVIEYQLQVSSSKAHVLMLQRISSNGVSSHIWRLPMPWNGSAVQFLQT